MKVRTVLILVGLLVAGCAGLIGLSIYLAVAPDRETLGGEFHESLTAVAFSPDGTTLAAGTIRGDIRIWDVTTRKERPKSLQGHSGQVNSLSFSPDGKTLASGSDDGVVLLWDMVSGVERHRIGNEDAPRNAARKDGPLPPGPPQVKSVAFRPDGRFLVCTFDRLVFWDPETRKEKFSVGKTGSVEALRFTPDGKYLATGGSRGIVLWDAETGEEAATVYKREDGPIPLDLAFSPDGKTVAWAGDDSNVHLWDVEGRKEIAQLAGHTDRVVAVAFHPDGKLLASGDRAEQVFLWDVTTQTQITFRQQAYKSLAGNPGGPVAGLAFSPDGKLLASAGGPIVKLWEVAKLVR